jgi:Kef-type K+ transport system membrane component KefB
MIMTLINEHGKKHKWLELALIIGIIGELISISALVIFDATIIYGFGKELYKNIAILIGVLLITYFSFKGLNILFWWFPRLKKIIMPDNDNMNQDIRFSMTLFFILIAIMQHLHLDMVLGSFIAGVFIANFFTHKIELPHTLHIVGFGFLIPLFFIYVGTTLDLNLLFTKEIIQKALYIILAMVFARIISSFVAYYQYLGLRDTILFSLGDSMPLTFLIAISTIAVNNHAITINEYYAFILAAILEAIVIVILIKFIMSKNSIQ